MSAPVMRMVGVLAFAAIAGCAGSNADPTPAPRVTLEGARAVAFNDLLARMPAERHANTEACARAWFTAMASGDRATQLSCVREPERTAAFLQWEAEPAAAALTFMKALDTVTRNERALVEASVERNGKPATMRATMVREGGHWWITLAAPGAELVALLERE